MKSYIKNIVLFYALFVAISFLSSDIFSQVDTSYSGIAPKRIQRILKPGKAPVFTIQVGFQYNTGLMDLASNDNTRFRRSDFVGGRNFGTRHGIGASVIGKLSLHKRGNVRLLIVTAYNRFQSDLIISRSPEGNVYYNVFSGGLGLENCFTPDRHFKPYMSFEIIASMINGEASITSDTGDYRVKIKNSLRLGGSVNLGFEYAFNNQIGFNFGLKFTNANILLKESKAPSTPYETTLNDDYVNPSVLYSGWKQFFYVSFSTGFNFYFGLKNRK